MRRIFIISDLHLGGRSASTVTDGPLGTRMCQAYGALIRFIDWVANQGSADQSVELVINGDIVDFLAEDDYPDGLNARVFTPNQKDVLTKLSHIFAATRLRTDAGGELGVLESLAGLLRAGGSLTLMLGNHDVELALPEVRDWLVDKLGGPSSRLRFFYDGEAYRIGQLLIEHGNRYDRWNQIDHSALRQERSMLSRGLRIDEKHRSRYFFVPPAGTHLVIHFMNRIKARYRFVDLLKPETGAVIPLLAALEPDYLPTLNQVLQAVPIGLSWMMHGLVDDVMPRRPGDLAGGTGQDLAGVLLDELGPSAALFPLPLIPMDGNMAGGVDGLLYRAQRWLETAASQLVAQPSSLLTWLMNKSDEQRLRQLHAALWRVSRKDQAFDPTKEDDEYLNAARKLRSEGPARCVVFGHTHLPKQIREGELTYLNTGTWADVIRLPKLTGNFAADLVGLTPFVEAMANNTLDKYICRYLSFAEIELDAHGDVVKDNGELRARVHSFCGSGRERAPMLTPHSL